MQLRERTVLVTGGAGFIGSHLVDALINANCHEVRVLDDLSTGRRDHLNEEAVFHQGDIRDADLVRRVMSKVDIVYHLACRGLRQSSENPTESHEVNASATLQLLGEAKKAGVKRFVHVSSSKVYGTTRSFPIDENHPCFPETIYAASKLAGESYARSYQRTFSLPVVVVRPFNNFGPRSLHDGDNSEVIPQFAVRALNGLPPTIYGDGAQTRDFIYVEDTAHWLCRIAECDGAIGRTINLGSGREVSIREVARLVCELAGKPNLVPEFASTRRADVIRHLGEMRTARELFGFHIRTSVADGIEYLLEYLRGQCEPRSTTRSRAA
jgi:UDP-glucose 4-epimerase